MACFIVPAAEAVITTVLTRAVKSKEKEEEKADVQEQEMCLDNDSSAVSGMYERIPFSRKLNWLNGLLWGGSGLLAFEHLWHGEIIMVFPFLTAASDPAGMIEEMSAVGVGMAIAVTLVWAGMAAVTSVMERRIVKPDADEAGAAEKAV